MERRWGFWHNYLVGIPWERWRVLRAENPIDPGYRHRAAFITLTSLRNSFYRRREEQRYAAEVARTEIADTPLFILGHWRSGTTYLHNLLACDTEQFGTPTSVQTTYPHTFLTTEEEVKRRFAHMLPGRRPMDNVALSLDSPQEDEFAMCTTCLRSPFLGMASFPRRAAHYDRYLTFRNASPEELAEWKTALLGFLKKLTYRYEGRPLLLKSPPHTARVRLLLDLFPRARFVHIHRHPYALFQSNRHLYRSLWPIHTLQRSPKDPEAQILHRYREMYDAYFEERPLIPAGQFHELRYDDLVSDPMGRVQALYERLGLDRFGQARPHFQAHVDSVADYRPNEFTALPEDARARVATAWSRSFEEWGYAR